MSWRAHTLASTLPAVARATTGRLVRCEWLVGLVVCVLSGSTSGFCVRCSPVRDSLDIGGPADSRAPVPETPNDGRPAVWRAADTETTGWTLRNTYDTAYQPFTSHKAAGRRSSNSRQGAGKRVRPPGQSTRRGLYSPSMRLITSTTWLFDRDTWPSSSSSWQRRYHLRPSRSGLALSSVDSLRPQGTHG